MIWLSVLHFFRKQQVQINIGKKQKTGLSDDNYLYLPPGSIQLGCEINAQIRVSCQLAKARGISLVSSLNSHVYWDSLYLE